MALTSRIMDSPTHPIATAAEDQERPATMSDRLVYLIARGAQAVVSRLPAPLALWLARRAGDLGYLAMPARREIAAEALRATFDLPPARERALVRAAFHHILLVGVELLLLNRRWRRRGGAHGLIPECREVVGLEVVREAQRRGRGMIFVTGHLGNWEVLGAIAASLDVKVTVVHRPLDNPLVDAWVGRMRRDFGTRLIEKEGAVKGLARALARGENVVLLMDQHAGRGGLRLPFLGRDASTFDTAARLARRFEVPLIGCFAFRRAEPFAFDLFVESVAEADPGLEKEADVVRMTRLVNDSISRAIRAHPDQWLWLHRRWREPRARKG